MAFMNCFLNFNINFAQPRFGFNFGCFSMPNFLQNMPLLNQFSYFSPTNWLQPYNNIGLTGAPSVFNIPTQNINYTNLSNTYNFNNSWQTNLASPCIDSFCYSTVHSPKPTSKRDSSANTSSKTYTYSSESDKYATNNASFLSNLTPRMREKTRSLIAYANSKGYDIRITSGKRTESQQQALIDKDEQNGTRYAAKSNSPHLSGIAIDIEVYKNGQKLENNASEIVSYAKTSLGMRWGGDFVNWTKEPWHFDLRNA